MNETLRGILLSESHLGDKNGVIVKGASNALAIAAFLVDERSAWCETTPLPDDEYEVKYKAENHQAVLGRFGPNVMDCKECSATVAAHPSGLCMRCGKRPFPKLDPTVKPNEIVVDLYDGLIEGVEFGEGVPASVVLKIVETDTNGLSSIDEERILDNNDDECFVREYQDTEKAILPIEEAVANLMNCTELNLDEMEPETVQCIGVVRKALALMKGDPHE